MAIKSSAVKQPAAAVKSQGPTKQGNSGFKIPIIGSKPIGKQLQLLGGALLAFLLLTVIAAYFDNRAAVHGTRYVAESSKLLMSSRVTLASNNSSSTTMTPEIAITRLLTRMDSDP